MEKENKPAVKIKKERKKEEENKIEQKLESPAAKEEINEKAVENGVKDNKINENRKEENAEEKTTNKDEQKEVKKAVPVKKDEAIAKSLSMHASKKHCMYICTFIKEKPIDKAIEELEEVIKMKRVIPFKGEIPHRKNMMSGRYPVNASKQFIYLLKALKGNSIINGMDIDKTRIAGATASWASRSAKRGGMRFKRTHVLLKAREISAEKKQ